MKNSTRCLASWLFVLAFFSPRITARERLLLLSLPQAEKSASQSDQVMAFLIAVQDNDVAKAKALLSAGFPVNAVDGNGTTALGHAIRWERREIVRLLIKAGADPNLESGGDTPLELAVDPGREDLLHILLRAGADPNRSKNGMTALGGAARSGNLLSVNALLASGAGVNQQGGHDMTALMWACWSRNPDVIARLIEVGADVNAKDDEGNIPLMYAVGSDAGKAVRLILARRPDVNAAASDGSTALMRAARCGDVEVCRMLLDAGASVNARDKTGCTAIEYARKEHVVEIVRLLRSRGAELPRSVVENWPLDPKTLKPLIERDDLKSVRTIIQAWTIQTALNHPRPESENPFWNDAIDLGEWADIRFRNYGERAVKKAQLAFMFGLFDTAAACYDRAFQTFPNDYLEQTHNAAVCAMLAGNEKQMLGFLEIMKQRKPERYQTYVLPDLDFMRRVAASPDTRPLRIEAVGRIVLKEPFMNRFERHALWSVRSILNDILRRSPTTNEKSRVYALLNQTARTLGDADAAEDAVRELLKYSQDSQTVSEILVDQAQFAFSQDRFAEAERWLKRFKDMARGDKSQTFADLMLSEVYEKLGKEDEMVEALKSSLGTNRVYATQRSIMDTSDTRQTALAWLGSYFKKKGRYLEAMAYYEAWSPSSWCGNGQAQYTFERNLALAECLVGLGRDEQALTKYVEPSVESGDNALYWDDRMITLYVDLIEKTGRLKDELRRLELKTASIAPELRAVHHPVLMQAARCLRQRSWLAGREAALKLVEDLMNTDDGSDPFTNEADLLPANHRRIRLAAVTALSDIGGAEIQVLKERFADSLALDKTDPIDTIRARGQSDRLWLLYAVARSKSPDADEFLESFVKKTRAGEYIGLRYEDFQKIIALRAEMKRTGR